MLTRFVYPETQVVNTSPLSRKIGDFLYLMKSVFLNDIIKKNNIWTHKGGVSR